MIVGLWAEVVSIGGCQAHLADQSSDVGLRFFLGSLIVGSVAPHEISRLEVQGCMIQSRKCVIDSQPNKTADPGRQQSDHQKPFLQTNMAPKAPKETGL